MKTISHLRNILHKNKSPLKNHEDSLLREKYLLQWKSTGQGGHDSILMHVMTVEPNSAISTGKER